MQGLKLWDCLAGLSVRSIPMLDNLDTAWLFAPVFQV